MAEAAPKKETKTKKRSARSRLKKWLLGLGIGLPVSILVLWILVHRVEWLGPLIANSLRAVIGPERVAKLEDFAYGIEDRFNRWWKKDEKPKAYWEVPPEESAQPVAAVDAGPDGPPPLPPFRPADVPPVHESWSAPGDGKWVRIVDPRRPKEPAYMFKTLLHPDKNRSWAELFVVAVDLRRVQAQAVAGYREPKSHTKEGMDYKRTATIPKEHQEELLAAFNGGFMTEHGWYGMKVDGVTLVKPRKKACTFAHYEDGSYEIATWNKIEEKEPKMKWYRQAPGCMYEKGEMHIGLRDPKNRSWGRHPRWRDRDSPFGRRFERGPASALCGDRQQHNGCSHCSGHVPRRRQRRRADGRQLVLSQVRSLRAGGGWNRAHGRCLGQGLRILRERVHSQALVS